jgi:hypothetical protein
MRSSSLLSVAQLHDFVVSPTGISDADPSDLAAVYRLAIGATDVAFLQAALSMARWLDVRNDAHPA